MNTTDNFIDSIYSLSKREYKAGEKEQALKCLIDYIGVTYAGSTMASIKSNKLLDLLSCANGEIGIIGCKRKSNIAESALIHGLFSHIAELDDGERFGMFHPGAPIFSALLPLVQKNHVDKEQFLRAIIVGYEASIRLAKALQPELKEKGFHGTGICGTIGAAISCGVALYFSKKQLKDVLSAAATSASGLLKVIRDDSEMKPFNVGIAAQNAISSVFLVLAGFNGPKDVLGGKQGFLSAFTNGYKQEELVFNDSSLAIMGIYQKPYAACRHCHSPIEAAIIIRENNNIEFENIVSIKVHTYYWAIGGHEHTDITGINSAKMSIPFSVAVALKTGQAGIQEFLPAWIRDKEVIDLNKKVSIFEDKKLTDLVPNKRSAIVEITTKNNKRIQKRIDYPKGEPENPLSMVELRGKFNSLLSFASIDKRGSDHILEKIMNIEHDLDGFIQTIYNLT